VFNQHSAESVCSLGVRYECNRGGFFVGLSGLCCRFKSLLYLLRTVSNSLENGGEKFQFLSKGILVTTCFGCVLWRPGPIVPLQNGDVNPSVDKDWYG